MLRGHLANLSSYNIGSLSIDPQSMDPPGTSTLERKVPSML